MIINARTKMLNSYMIVLNSYMTVIQNMSSLQYLPISFTAFKIQ